MSTKSKIWLFIFLSTSFFALGMKSTCNSCSGVSLSNSNVSSKFNNKCDGCNFNNCNDCDFNNCNSWDSNSCKDKCNFSCDGSCDLPCNLLCDDDCAISRTIFIPRQQTTDSVNDLALSNYHFYHHTICPEDRAFFHIQASYFHKESRNECDLAGYFFPNGQRCINIREDGSGDVGSLWIELISSKDTKFDSTLCIAPKRKIDGGFFNFYFDFNSWLCGSWLSISFAAMRAEHNLCLRESNVENPGTINNIETAIDAFNNPTWTAGKLSPNKLCRSGVDDVQFKLGWNYYFCNQDHLGIYFVATAPTGCRTRNEFLFEPVVGTRHGSVGVGFNGDYTVWECGNQGVTWMADFKYRFVLSHCERRLFDLCDNGPFSRYLQVVTESERSLTLPGVNFFAVPVDVRPGSTIDLWTAFHYYWCDFNFEVGYNLWWKDCEEICIRSADLGVGIYDINGDCKGDPFCSTGANITQTVAGAGSNFAPSDTTFKTISTSDFNIASGSHPRSLSHTIYGAFSYNTEVWCMPVMLGFVGSYEFARCNTTFEQWGVHLKTAISF